MERKLRLILIAVFVSCLCVAHVAMAADDGQTQPRVNQSFSNSTTAADIIGTTSGSGNVKGVACTVYPDGSGYLSSARVTFTVNGGTAQTVDLYTYVAPYNNAGTVTGYTGWVPFNVRFSSSIRVQIQKTSVLGTGIDCTVSWGLD
jgi:hypothetical protein